MQGFEKYCPLCKKMMGLHNFHDEPMNNTSKGKKVIFLNKIQMKNKDLVKQFTSGGFKVVKDKKVPMNKTSKGKDGEGKI